MLNQRYFYTQLRLHLGDRICCTTVFAHFPENIIASSPGSKTRRPLVFRLVARFGAVEFRGGCARKRGKQKTDLKSSGSKDLDHILGAKNEPVWLFLDYSHLLNFNL
jgi:hypothetical protein